MPAYKLVTFFKAGVHEGQFTAERLSSQPVYCSTSLVSCAANGDDAEERLDCFA
jgi:hypothetical protein